MLLRKLALKNFTVFDKLDVEFSPGINIFIGLNGTGKTHVMKILYSACRTVDKKVSFPQKLVGCFGTEDHNISRLVRRSRGNSAANITIKAGDTAVDKPQTLSCGFSRKDRRWDAKVTGKDAWEQQLGSSIFRVGKDEFKIIRSGIIVTL